MAFAGDREDVNSLCLSAVHRLLQNYGIAPTEVPQHTRCLSAVVLECGLNLFACVLWLCACS